MLLSLITTAPRTEQVTLVLGGSRKQKIRTAYELFKASSLPRHSFNVIALIDQRDPFGAGWQRIKVVRQWDGTVVKSVLSPMRMQGVESIDDGTDWKTLLPDEKVVMIQKSPTGKVGEMESRFQLARRNYSFLYNGTTSVAGRECYRLSVTSHFSQIPSWTLYLDCATAYPLRMDSTREGAQRVEFVSRAVDFPKRVEANLTKFEVPTGFKTINYDMPENLSSAQIAQQELGFIPYIPHRLPFGFRVQDMQVSKSSSWKALVFRITDGMARASIYEYLNETGVAGAKPFENSSMAMAGVIQLMLVSDVSKDCRERLLECFTKKPDKEK